VQLSSYSDFFIAHEFLTMNAKEKGKSCFSALQKLRLLYVRHLQIASLLTFFFLLFSAEIFDRIYQSLFGEGTEDGHAGRWIFYGVAFAVIVGLIAASNRERD